MCHGLGDSDNHIKPSSVSALSSFPDLRKFPSHEHISRADDHRSAEGRECVKIKEKGLRLRFRTCIRYRTSESSGRTERGAKSLLFYREFIPAFRAVQQQFH